MLKGIILVHLPTFSLGGIKVGDKLKFASSKSFQEFY